jgi:tripartite-type tricarboxylate transporter receptor subunit TctC
MKEASLSLPVRRALLRIVGSAAMPLGVAPAVAQGRSFPDRPIRMIVPWPPGGVTDVQMRALCEQAARRLGQPIVVENRPGATGSLGAVALKDGQPDGYLLSQMPPAGVFRLPHMTARPPFNPTTDFTWIMQVTGYLFGVVVRADASWRTFPEFLDHAQANPGQINYGTPGVGSPLHVTMERIAGMRGIRWTHVPFRGSTENLQALAGGHVHASADGSTWAPMVEAGRLRLLVTFGAERAKHFPDVPTLTETGIDLVVPAAYGIAGPRGIDLSVLRILHAAFKEALHDPAHRTVLDNYNMPVLYLDAESYALAAARHYEEEREVVRMLGLRMQ